jgi:hypothetical protein
MKPEEEPLLATHRFLGNILFSDIDFLRGCFIFIYLFLTILAF